MSLQKAMTLGEFLVWEQTQEVKHEYFRGHVYVHPMRVAMPGGSPNHNEIEANLMFWVFSALQASSFRVLTSNQMIVADAGEAAFYPDVVVLDGPRDLRKYGKLNAAGNAVVVFEIASPGTENYDRGRKLDAYKAMSTMREVVLLQATEARIERFVRSSEGWVHEVFEGLDAELPVLNVRIPLKQIYQDVDVPPFSLGLPFESSES